MPWYWGGWRGRRYNIFESFPLFLLSPSVARLHSDRTTWRGEGENTFKRVEIARDTAQMPMANVNDIRNGRKIQGELLSLRPAVGEMREYLFLKRNAILQKEQKRQRQKKKNFN